MVSKATSNTKSMLLQLAAEMLEERGFGSFSYQDLASRIGIRKASIHYHYPAKTDLGLALIDFFKVDMQKRADAFEEVYNTAAERLGAYLAQCRKQVSSGSKISALCMLASEYVTLPEAMQSALGELLEEQHNWLSSLLYEAKSVLPNAENLLSDDLARSFNATVQGAILQGRVQGLVFFDAAIGDLVSRFQLVIPREEADFGEGSPAEGAVVHNDL